mgnify:FL=1
MPTLEFEGKAFVYSHHLSVPYRELIPVADKGVGAPDLDGNLIIHGDNLEALKALLPRYAGKVDVIYIDPPYNTGNEGWAYNDNVNSPMMKEWLNKVVDGEDLQRHDKWLCMMWPRLQLLSELLAPTGIIFVSIEENEQAHLVQAMKESFSAQFLGSVPVVNNLKGRNDKGNFARAHEYMIVFAGPAFESQGLPLNQKQLAAFRFEDERGEKYAVRDMRKRGGADTRALRANLFFPIFFDADGTNAALTRRATSEHEVFPMKSDGSEGCWKWGKRKVEQNLSILSMTKGRGAAKGVGYRLYLNPDIQPGGPDATDEEDAWDEEADEPIERVSKPKSFWWGPELSTDGAGKQLKAILPEGPGFDYPKPVALVERAILMGGRADALILDSFAGSGTTAHAVLAANSKDGGSRKFILIEAEDYADNLTAERVRRVIKGVPKAKEDGLKQGFGGAFTYCELGKPMDSEQFFAGDAAPSWEQVARYVLYTATGETAAVPPEPTEDFFAAEAGGRRVHVIYRPDRDFLRSADAALTLERARAISAVAKESGKSALVFGAAQYVSARQLRDLDVTFAQLPWSVHQRLAGVSA